jgi:hypothetical protein
MNVYSGSAILAFRRHVTIFYSGVSTELFFPDISSAILSDYEFISGDSRENPEVETKVQQ